MLKTNVDVAPVPQQHVIKKSGDYDETVERTIKCCKLYRETLNPINCRGSLNVVNFTEHH